MIGIAFTIVGVKLYAYQRWKQSKGSKGTEHNIYSSNVGDGPDIDTLTGEETQSLLCEEE